MQATRSHAQPIPEVLAALDTTPGGLSDAEARRRLETFGPNQLPPPPRTSALRVLLDQFRSVVVFLLLAATLITFFLGDALEAAAIAMVLVINTILGFTTELRARRAMEAILHLDEPRATVVRDGQLRAVDARELVPGDVIELTPGRQVPADARLLESTDLRINEAPLTGESMPVSKSAGAMLANDRPLADRTNMIYSGTMAVAGIGRAVVTATAGTTEVGRIGELVSGVAFEPTPLERRLNALGHRLVWLALAVAAVVAGLSALQGAPLDLIIRTGIALAVAAVPEALPVVATIALAVGLRRMAARHALVRRLPAVESLGSTTVICTDKTRTLTSGQMAVVRIHGDAQAVLETAALASRTPVQTDRAAGTAEVDPVDLAVLDAATKAGIDRDALVRARPEAGVIPFSSSRKLMAGIHQVDGGLVAYVKGAPGRVLDTCAMMTTETGEGPLDAAGRQQMVEANNALAADGLRVLGVAAGRVREAGEEALTGLTFLGFIGLADPPAPGVGETIARLRQAGLRTIMLTGDQRLTAEAIGRQLGVIREGDAVVAGAEMDALDPVALRDMVARAGVFSRITPEHKLRIVEALQQRGEIVAMLGDGVNDAPALRRADVGVAMGMRGTDAAKQAAAIVLQDDRFETVAAAVEEGRVIFDNIRKFVFYLFSCNVAEVLVLLVAGLASLPMPLLPLHLLWLNMITDTFPALALAMEPPESDVMQRPPLRPDGAILSRPFLTQILIYGGMITAVTLAAFIWALEASPDRATTIAFMTLALAQIAHLGNARRATAVLRLRAILANPYALGAVVLSVGLQVATIYVEPLRRVLRLSSLDTAEWGVVIGLAALPAIAGQAWKIWRPAAAGA